MTKVIRRGTNMAVCVALLYLFCGAVHGAEGAVSGGTQPFAATGLLIRPDEPAEEILLRAHQGDTRAMLLAVIGYQRGIGGFPKAPVLSLPWIVPLMKLASPEAVALSSLIVSDDVQQSRLGTRLAYCDSIHEKSELSAALRMGGVYDAKQVCKGLEDAKKENPGWEDAYAAATHGHNEQSVGRNAMRTVRELRSRNASAKDINALSMAYGNEFLPFFAATTHDPATAPPNWNAERLLAFLNAQAPSAKDVSLDDGYTLDMINDEIVDELERKLPKPFINTIDNIRQAHQGNPDAVLTMALQYEEGDSGFLKSFILSSAWLTYGAYHNDSRCQFRLALLSLYVGNKALALSWASFARDDPHGTLRGEAAKLAAMIEPDLDEQQRENFAQIQQFFRDEIRQYAEWKNDDDSARHSSPTLHDESAEEILLRAHQFDVEAAALAAAGYSRGQGGFPKEPVLAQEWADIVYNIGAYEVGNFIQLLIWRDKEADSEEPVREEIAAAYCGSFHNNDMVENFYRAGLFEPETICPQELNTSTSQHVLSNRKQKVQTIRENMLLVRELRTRPATSEELRRLHDDLSSHALVFFAATTHDPLTQRPDWNNERLVDFMAAQKQYLPTLLSEEPDTEELSYFETALFLLNRCLSKRVAENPDDAAAAIKLAQEGNMNAANIIGRYYREGSFGFISDNSLADSWRYYAAVRGDGLNLFLLAIENFKGDRLAEAWSAAKLSSEYGTGELQSLAAYLLDRIGTRKDKYDQQKAWDEYKAFKIEIAKRKEWQKRTIEKEAR